MINEELTAQLLANAQSALRHAYQTLSLLTAAGILPSEDLIEFLDTPAVAQMDERLNGLKLAPKAEAAKETPAPLEVKARKFRTADGYTLTYSFSANDWSDGDLFFKDLNGRPVDASGEPLEGEFV